MRVLNCEYLRLRGVLLAMLIAAISVSGFVPAVAAEGDGAAVHRIRIARERPPCSGVPELPIVPNDPGALVTAGGTRCYGTRPPELELWLPEDRYLWLARHAPNPAAWIDLGPVLVDARRFDPPPLGLKLSRAEQSWTLETRYGETATLTRIEPGEWHEITSPDGQRFWVRVEDERTERTVAEGRIRYRAD